MQEKKIRVENISECKLSGKDPKLFVNTNFANCNLKLALSRFLLIEKKIIIKITVLPQTYYSFFNKNE